MRGRNLSGGEEEEEGGYVSMSDDSMNFSILAGSDSLRWWEVCLTRLRSVRRGDDWREMDWWICLGVMRGEQTGWTRDSTSWSVYFVQPRRILRIAYSSLVLSRRDNYSVRH